MQTLAVEPASPTLNKNPQPTIDSLRVRNIALFTVSAAVLLQLALFLSIDNLIASVLVLCGAFVGLTYAADRQLLIEYRLSTLGIIGYTLYYFVLPPLGQLLDFHSVIHNLNRPVLVWAYGIIGLPYAGERPLRISLAFTLLSYKMVASHEVLSPAVFL